MKKIIYLIGISLFILASCSKPTIITERENIASPSRASATKTLYGPIAEERFYKLFSGYSSSDDFEGSGVYASGSYLYVVFDNRFKIGKILNTLPQNSGSNTLIGSGSGSSNFEAITYDDYNTPNWYIGIESEKNGSSYYPKVREYDNSLAYQSYSWTDVTFSSSNSNKACEGLAYVRRSSNDYLLCLAEGTGKISVLQQTSSSWQTISSFYIPVTMTDYSDIAVYGSKIAVTSQEDAQVWLGTLSSTSWGTVGSGTVYAFPKGNSAGVAGAGSNTIYSRIEGISFINDSTIVTCTDKADSGDPSYKKYKDQSIQIFKLR